MIQELADHLLRRIKDFHTHRSLRLDTAVTENILIQGRLLKMCQIGKGHPAELEHKDDNSVLWDNELTLREYMIANGQYMGSYRRNETDAFAQIREGMGFQP